MEPSLPQFVDGSSRTSIATAARSSRRGDGGENARGVERPRSVDGMRGADRGGPPVEQVFPRERNEVASRALNFMVAAAALVVSTPLFVLVGALIKATSRGPIFYAQTRVGMDRRWRETLALHERRQEDLGGRVFTIYKFRTMRVDAEKKSGAVWAQQNDPRVTTLGKYLRMFRVDEVPQFWNVLRGEMNVVGPRPERPSIVARLRDDIPEYQFRHRVKPGLTGLAQINQKYDACLDDVRGKVNWDLQYLRTQGFWRDVRIMVQTVPSVLLRFRGW
jgi:lipopolysaccharide/colanic/teichoic acid biosynthesis glycosyltransferase